MGGTFSRGLRLAILVLLCASTAAADPTSGYDKLIEQANNYADAYNCTKAEEVYQQALRIKPRGVEALVGSGNCMARQSKWTDAHLRFDKALSINPKYEPALWGKAEAYRLAYKKDDAIAAYKHYLDVFPRSSKAKQALDKLGGVSTTATRPDPNLAVRPGRYPARSQDVSVVITGTRIVCNGVDVSGTPQLADFVAIYGKPDRVWDTKGGVNKVHTWDRLGLIVYEPMDGRAISATFPFKPMGLAYDPSSMFHGSIVVDGYALSSTTSLAGVKSRPGASQPYSSTSVVLAKGDFNVFVTGKKGSLDLVELSLWKNGKPADTSVVAATGGGKYKSTRELKIVVSGTRVTMNGIDIGGKPMLADIEKIYGKPDRTWDTGASNRVHTWDKLGLVVYEPRDGRCISTTFPYKPMGSSYDPTTMFGGSITVDGRPMTSSLTIPSVKARPGASQPYGASSIVFDKGDVHVFTISKNNGTIDLVEISYWQRDKNGAAVGKSGSKGPVARAQDVRVEVVGSKVKLQGIEIGGKPRLDDIVKIFGKPDRVWDKKGGANRIHVWDDLGFIVYEPYDGRAISLTMPYKSMNNDFSPNTLFKGRVSLDSHGFYNFNTISTIKKRAGATQPYGALSVVFDLGDIHVFTSAPKPTTETIDLVEISFWQTK